tara:strand:- start:838 stop:3633 length:2796 start_codon:yes stop_codon:yes gene_type:complete
MLTLTTAQEALRRKLLSDHIEPLYWMRIDHEVLTAVAVSATDISSRTLTLTGDVSAAENYTGFSSTSSSSEAAEELASALGSRAFRKGNTVYIRAAFQDSTLIASGDLISTGDASVLFVTPRSSEFCSGAKDIRTPPDFVRFDTAPNEYVSYGQTDDLAGEALATWSGWVRLSSNYGSGFQGYLISFLYAGGWRLQVHTSYRASVSLFDSSGGTAQEISSSGVFTPGQWHHLAATFSGGTVVLYVDGSAVASSTTGTMPSAIQPVSVTTGLQTLRIGDNFGQGANSADLKHVAYWAGAAASAAQVAELYGSGTPPDLETLPTLTAPTFWAPFDGTYDLRLGSQSPTVVGSPAFGPEGHATASILEVSTMGLEKDPWTKEVSGSARSVVLRGDAAVRRLLTENVLVGREVTIRRGLAGYPVSYWLPSGSYILSDGPIPTDIQSTAEDGFSAYRLKLRDKIDAILENSHLLASEDNQAFLTARHPLEMASYLLQLSIYQGSAASGLSNFLDESTFDPSASTWSDVGHYNAVRLNFTSGLHLQPGFNTRKPEVEYKSGFTRPTKIAKILDELRTIIPGQIVSEEDGKVRAKRIDYSSIPGGTATIHDWTEEFEPDEAPDLMADLINEIIVDLSQDMSGDEWSSSFSDRNNASIRAHGIPSANPVLPNPSGGRRSDDSIGLSFGGKSYMFDATNATNPSTYNPALHLSGLTFRVYRGSPFGFCGARSDILGGAPYTLPSWASLSSSRVALFRLSSPEGDASSAFTGGVRQEATEYIECNASAIDASAPAEGYGTTFYDAHGAVRFTISKRAALGTTSPDFWNSYSRITDCTIARALTTEYLDRWGWGFPVVKGRTRLGLLHHQVGDFVTISLPRLIGFGGEGAEALGLVFEIIGKEEAFDRVTWRLGLASRLTPYVAVRQPLIPSFTISAGDDLD